MSEPTDKERGLDGGTRATERGTAKQSRAHSSPAAAATGAIKEFNPQSVSEGREYGGTLYRPADSKKTRYVLPPNVQERGTPGGHVNTKQEIPKGAVETGRWHTHGKTENYTDEDFSGPDLQLARARGLPSYLGTPKGAVKVAIPQKSGFLILDLVPAEGTRPNIRSVPDP